MPHQHRIHVRGKGGSLRPFGTIYEPIEMEVCVGVSRLHSSVLSKIKLTPKENDGRIQFVMEIDGQVYRTKTFNRPTKKFTPTLGRKINGSMRSQKLREARQ